MPLVICAVAHLILVRPNLVRAILLLCCIWLCAACGRCGFGSYYTRGLKQYSGDGAISDTSQSGGLFGTNGYIVDFPKFDLGTPHRATYRFTGLPSLGSAKAEIELMIDDPTGYRGHLVSDVDKFRDTLKAIVTLSLVDSSGRTIAKFESPLKNLIWSSPIHDRSGYALYDLENSFFPPRSGANYALTIDYSGDSSLAGQQGAVDIWCGCGGS